MTLPLTGPPDGQIDDLLPGLGLIMLQVLPIVG